jgi:Arc/MetJ-type ribon-helix-helix transcriptional regulator
MARMKSTENTEILNVRISKSLKDKLNQLAKSSKYGGSASSTIRYLIEYHSRL